MRAAKVWQGIAFGAASGLLGSLVMNAVPAIWKKLEENGQQQQSGGDDATMKAADKIAEPVIGRHLDPEEKKTAGPAVHYAFGTTVGALYGGLAAAVPAVTLGLGTLYGAAVWLGGDKWAVPKLGLAPPPEKTSANDHAKALTSHIVYGLTLEGGRRLLTRYSS